MDGSAEPTALAAQRAAIQAARTRYERGDLSYDAFRRALDALVLARDSAECQTILDALPVSPLAALAALDSPPPTSPVTASPPHHKRIIAFMSQIKKLRRPWQLGESTHAVAFMGEIKLDLRLAGLPSQGKLYVTAVMGAVTILVPRSVRVTVHSTIIMSDTHALGEGVTGMFGFGHEEHAPASGPATAQLDIEVFSLMGNVKIVLTGERPTVSVSELVRDALRAVAAGAQRGLRQGASQYPSLSGPGNRDEWYPSGQ